MTCGSGLAGTWLTLDSGVAVTWFGVDGSRFRRAWNVVHVWLTRGSGLVDTWLRHGWHMAQECL